MISIQEILSSVINEVLGNDFNNNFQERFNERLHLLYMIPLTSLTEATNDSEKIGAFVAEIVAFEKRFIRTSEKYIDVCSEINTENMIQLFSVISYQLAISRWMGNPFSLIAYFMNEYYEGFFEDIIENQYTPNNIKTILEDIGLDLNYACYATDTMSIKTMHDILFLERNKKDLRGV